MKKKTEDFNSFERIVEMFEDMGADMVMVCSIDKHGMVVGEPYNSKTGQSWAMSMISSFEELIDCKYQKAVPKECQRQFNKLLKTNSQTKQKETEE